MREPQTFLQTNKDIDFSFFRDAVTQRHQSARLLTQTRKVIGYFCDFVPEELLDAAGFVPIRLLGARESISLADKYLQSNACSFARSCLELVLNGTYRYLSGVVIPHSCDVITKMNDLWAYRSGYPDFCHYLWYPHKASDPAARTAFIDEVRRLKKSIEEFTGKEISDESLRGSVKRYNENRRLLREMYELRKAAAPPLTGVEAFSVTISSLLMPKETHSLRLRELLAELPARSVPKKAGPRILLSAAVLDDFELIGAIEGLGGAVVVDDSCTGIRYFWEEVREDGDPIEAVADRYLQKIPCPRTFDSGARADFLMKNIKDYAVGGVIIYLLRCCDAHLFQLPGLQQRLKSAGVPALYLQGDHLAPISEETRTRIAAFIEMVGG
jgi:benzoyl-CoA reductase subunit C